MKQEYINALRKIRNLANRLFNETDNLMEKMEGVNDDSGCVDIREEEEDIYRVVGMLHNDIEERSAEIEQLCTELGID